MQICYHMVKIDGTETLCIGGKIFADEENPGMLWLTSVQGEKLLHIHHSNYRAITRFEAEEHLRAAHARKQAEGGGELEALCIKSGEHIPLTPIPPAPQLKKSFKQFPAWPEPPAKPWNT